MAKWQSIQLYNQLHPDYYKHRFVVLIWGFIWVISPSQGEATIATLNPSGYRSKMSKDIRIR
jgi:hypothetical protein